MRKIRRTKLCSFKHLRVLMIKESFVVKRAYSQALSAFVAVVSSYFFARSEPFWIPLTAILVMQTAVGISLRQGLERFFIIILSVAFGTVLVLLIHQSIVLYIIIVIVFCFSNYFALKDSLNLFILTRGFLIGFILLITMLSSVMQISVLYARLYDVTLGACIGIAINLLIYPSRVDVEFRSKVIPILNAYETYLTAIIELFLHKGNSEKRAEEQKILLENKFQTRTNAFPSWVYESGLSVSIQSGHRHFLVMTERVAEILFSLHHIARHSFDKTRLENLEDPLLGFAQATQKLFQALITILNLQKLSQPVSDLEDELIQLEKAFQIVAPPSLELLDLSEDYILLAAFLTDLKDLRGSLVRLSQALIKFP